MLFFFFFYSHDFKLKQFLLLLAQSEWLRLQILHVPVTFSAKVCVVCIPVWNIDPNLRDYQLLLVLHGVGRCELK